ncbi:MAG: tryptophan synthase subunit alpha [Saprospiraceae bacterium]|nr:tryptophan synthase subunit alpha [Saprospiraceae bacterium]
MNRIEKLFAQKKEGILNIFLTAGYPGLDDMPKLVKTLELAGVDMVEIGMPYSDPLADGETIQASSKIALENGMTLDILFEQIQELRPQVKLPIILMGYFNQVLQYGEHRFIETCKRVGVDGLILPDLPLIELERRYHRLFADAELPISLLVCPSTTEARIRQIEALSTGFIYLVADAATTGNAASINEQQLLYFKRIQAMKLTHPSLIGFGISDKNAFDQASQFAQGAIIGSAFIRAISGLAGEQLHQAAENFVQRII